jgi:DNA-binding transcriptional ArsR family regulator
MSVEYLEEADLVARPLRIAAAPVHSLLMAARDAAGAERAGTPEAWRRVIRAHLTRRDYDVLAPLATSRPTLVPSALVPLPEPPAQTLKDGLEQLVAAEDALSCEIHECMDSGGAGDWREPARDPQRWIRGVALAMTRAWAGFRPIWQDRHERIGAEIERVTAAAQRGAHLHVLGELIACGHVRGDRWVTEWPGGQDLRLEVPATGLTLIPLVSGSRASIVDIEGPVLRLVGYPLRAGRHEPEPTLEALLGNPRARILRELHEPATNNQLAAALQTVPSAATHHVSALAAAGLVVRDRSNGSLLVRRTARGDTLVALYDPGWIT